MVHPSSARQRTVMVALTVQVVMLVCQDGRGGRSLRRSEIFRNVAKSSETAWLFAGRKHAAGGSSISGYFFRRAGRCRGPTGALASCTGVAIADVRHSQAQFAEPRIAAGQQ